MVLTPAPARTMRLSCLPAKIASPVTSVERTTRMPTPSKADGSVSLVSSGRERISIPRTFSSSSAARSILSATRRRMRPAPLPEILAFGPSLLASACASDHHVSPWGERQRPAFEAFLVRPDLALQLAQVDAETRALGLA